MGKVNYVTAFLFIVCILSACKDATQKKEFLNSTAETIMEQSDESVADEAYQNILEIINNMDFSVKTP